MTVGKEQLSAAALRRLRHGVCGAFDGTAHYAREPVTGAELRARIDHLNVPYARIAGWLGLSVDGLHKQMRGDRRVTPQTVLALTQVETVFMHQLAVPHWCAMPWAEPFLANRSGVVAARHRLKAAAE